MVRDTNSESQALKFGAAITKLFEKLRDVGEKRIAEIDAARIYVQVFSLPSPGTEQLEADDVMALARESNDLLPDCRQGLSRWRGGRYRVVNREILGAADVVWVTEKGESCDPFTKNDAGRTPAP